MRIRVYYEDTDLGGVVYHTNYLKYCERARSEAFFKEKQNPFTDDGHFLVRDLSCKFISSAELGDELDVYSKLVTLKGASFTLVQEIYKGKKLIFQATLNLVYVCNKRPTKIPEVIKILIRLLS